MRSGHEVIHDRLAFAGTNYKPLLVMRDAWAIEASDALRKMAQLKRTYDNEKAAHTAAQAQAAQLGGNGDGQPPAKRMRVRSAQMHKAKHAGSLTVQEGDTCMFVKAATNPLWSFVKMDDDGRVGVVSASKLEDLPEDMALADPSDSEEGDEAELEVARENETLFAQPPAAGEPQAPAAAEPQAPAAAEPVGV